MSGSIKSVPISVLAAERLSRLGELARQKLPLCSRQDQVNTKPPDQGKAAGKAQTVARNTSIYRKTIHNTSSPDARYDGLKNQTRPNAAGYAASRSPFYKVMLSQTVDLVYVNGAELV